MADSDIEVTSASTNQPGHSLELQPLSWQPLVLTHDKIVWLWEQCQSFPQLFDDFTKGNFHDFLNKLLSPANVFVDIGPGIGMAAGYAVRTKLDMVVHLVMFDKRLRGREPIFLDVMGFFFRELQLQRMTSIIPDDCRTAIKLAGRLGFKAEGVMRRAVLRDGKALDMHIFGLLREEYDGKVAAQSERSIELSAADAGQGSLSLADAAS